MDTNQMFETIITRLDSIDSNVAQNTRGINQNTTDIKDLKSAVAENGTAIQGLSASVAQNTTDIKDIKLAVVENASATQGLSVAVAQNTTDIKDLKSAVGEQITATQGLSVAVAQNTTDIKDLKSAVVQNSEDIKQNTEGIQSLVESVDFIRDTAITRDEFVDFKNEIITHIDGFAVIVKKFDVELISMGSKYERLEAQL